MVAAIEKASGKAFCRGECKYGTRIPVGEKCLRVMGCFYCEKCMGKIIDIFIKVIDESVK